MNTDNELLIKLDALISNWEDETVEFKEANNDYDKDKGLTSNLVTLL